MLFLFILLLIHKIRTEQDKNLLVHYDFTTFTDKTVIDCTGNGNDAILQNEATIFSIGKYNVLNLGIGTGYLDLGTKFGEIFASTNDFTISMYYRVHEDSPLDMNGRFLWTFSTL